MPVPLLKLKRKKVPSGEASGRDPIQGNDFHGVVLWPARPTRGPASLALLLFAVRRRTGVVTNSNRARASERSGNIVFHCPVMPIVGAARVR